jgi:glycosyltransferase involved in cell wall biosynthesis
MRPQLSVVIPVFDEESNVAPLVEELMPVAAGLGVAYEVIIVNDGSRDRTHEALVLLRAKHPALRYLRLAKNTGQTAGFDAGFRAARGEWIVTMDGDLQIDPADIPRLIARMRQGDVDFVFGRRMKRKDGFLKSASTKIANSVRNWLTGENIVDTGCPLKLLRREIVDRIPMYKGMHRFFITLAHIEGFRTAEVPVAHRPRGSGASKYGVWNRVFRALRDCLVVRWMQSRHVAYDVAEIGAAGEVQASTSRGQRASPALDRPFRGDGGRAQ